MNPIPVFFNTANDSSTTTTNFHNRFPLANKNVNENDLSDSPLDCVCGVLHVLLWLTSSLSHLLACVSNCLHAACPAVCGLVSGSTKTTYSIGQGPCMNYEKSFLVKSKKHVGDGFIPYFCLKWRKKFRSHLDRQCKHIGVTASVLFLLVSDFFLLFLDCEECVCWKVFRFHWASRQSAAE